MDRQGAAAWTSNLYMDWLGTLRELSAPLTDAKYPQALRTRAWAMKSLNTQLASWSQLRHDTILYAKQSYTAGGACSFPALLVEPHPTFWTRAREMVERTSQAISSLTSEGSTRFVYRQARSWWQARADALADRDPNTLSDEERQQLQFYVGEADLIQIQQRQLNHLGKFAEALRNLESIAQLQANGDQLSNSSWLEEFACNLIQQLTPGGGSAGLRNYSGWYPQLFYRSILHDKSEGFHEDTGVGKFDAIVADVHTDVPCDPCGDPGSVLHEGIGRVNMAFIVVEFSGQPVMFAGPVLSHFEFELIGPPRRLADSEWKAAIELENPISPPLRPEWRDVRDQFGNVRRLPPLPPWTREYLVPGL